MTEERVAKSEVAQPLRLERASELTAHGESLASHRDGRGAPPARRDDREYREYLSEEQRSRRGCIARRMQPDFHHGLLAHVAESKLSTAEDTGDAEEKSRFEQVRTSYPPCPPWWRGNLNRTRGAFLCLTQSPLT